MAIKYLSKFLFVVINSGLAKIFELKSKSH